MQQEHPVKSDTVTVNGKPNQVDIERATAATSEKSKASALLKGLMEAGIDTLKHRNPELYDSE